MVNPAKTAVQVQQESEQGKELYRVSHQDYDVGELQAAHASPDKLCRSRRVRELWS